MILTTWTSIKTIKADTSNTIYYSTEIEYCSDDPSVSDVYRYYIHISGGIDDYYCFITKETPESTDQTDFEDNYKSTAIGV